MAKLWIVGEVLNDKQNNWIFQGIYSTEEKAILKCVTVDMFISEVEVDFDEPRELREFDICYYPLLETKEEKYGKT